MVTSRHHSKLARYQCGCWFTLAHHKQTQKRKIIIEHTQVRTQYLEPTFHILEGATEGAVHKETSGTLGPKKKKEKRET